MKTSSCFSKYIRIFSENHGTVSCRKVNAALDVVELLNNED